MLTGDCSFDFIPTSAGLTDADYMVVPHHGGKVMMNRAISLKSSCETIVSSGFLTIFQGQNYLQKYDQKVFLHKCGITQQMKFLKSYPKYYEIKGV